MFKLVRYFSLASLALFLLVFVPVLILAPKRVQTINLEMQSKKNVDLATIFTHSLGTGFYTMILRAQYLEDQPLIQQSRFERFDAEIRKRMQDSSIVKAKFFNLEGTTLYSSHVDEIGLSNVNSTGFQKALQGEVFSSGRAYDRFEALDTTLEKRFIVSTLMPIHNDKGELIGVFELFADATETHALWERIGQRIVLFSVIIACLLYAILFIIIRRGERVIKQQYQELSQIKEQLEEQTANLKRSNEELELFAYTASHDLQEPLRKVQAFGDRLAKKYGDILGETGLMYVDRMQDASGRMRGLIQDLLSYSRVATKGDPFISVDLNILVNQVVSDLEVRISETQATLNIADLPKMQADPLQMRQLFQNLIGNALKFHKPDVPPVIDVLSTQKDGKLYITVQDNGVGFDEQYAEKVFQIFQRLHGRGEFEGTGMGLAIVRKIVERHGGTISAESAEGKGASFKICFASYDVPSSHDLNPKETLILQPQLA